MKPSRPRPETKEPIVPDHSGIQWPPAFNKESQHVIIFSTTVLTTATVLYRMHLINPKQTEAIHQTLVELLYGILTIEEATGDILAYIMPEPES